MAATALHNAIGLRNPAGTIAYSDRSSRLARTSVARGGRAPVPSDIRRQPEHGARMDAVGIAEDGAVRLEDRLAPVPM
jgi:hypothetical protein